MKTIVIPAHERIMMRYFDERYPLIPLAYAAWCSQTMLYDWEGTQRHEWVPAFFEWLDALQAERAADKE